MNATKPMVFELHKKNACIETLEYTGPAWRDGEPEAATTARRQFVAGVLERAAELCAFPYERVNPNWLEAVQTEFPCREVNGSEVEVTSTVGTFRLEARRARTGDLMTDVSATLLGTGLGVTASRDQVSLPVVLRGRLNPPRTPGTSWTFQPSRFIYEDGTSSGDLGGYPRDIVWIGDEPQWF